LVVFAGKLTSIDAAAVSSTQNIKSEVSSLDSKVEELNSRIARLATPRVSSGPTPVSPATTPVAELEITKAAILANQEERNSLVARREAFEKLLSHAYQTELGETTRDKLKDTNYITATFFTRVGVLVILIFLVQILISLYKYNTRMIAFYSSRLDCLRLSGGELPEFDVLLKLLTPANVDFGPEAKHPIQHLLAAWRQKDGKAEHSRSPRKRAEGKRENKETAATASPAPAS
jgi:hypothetical protein